MRLIDFSLLKHEPISLHHYRNLNPSNQIEQATTSKLVDPNGLFIVNGNLYLLGLNQFRIHFVCIVLLCFSLCFYSFVCWNLQIVNGIHTASVGLKCFDQSF